MKLSLREMVSELADISDKKWLHYSASLIGFADEKVNPVEGLRVNYKWLVNWWERLCFYEQLKSDWNLEKN